MKTQKKNKKELTPEQLEAKAFKRLVSKVKSDCKSSGLNSVNLKLDYLKNNNVSKLPEPLLDLEKTINAFNQGIDEYKTEIIN